MTQEELDKHWSEITAQAAASAERANTRANAPFMPLIPPTDTPSPQDLQWEVMRHLIKTLRQEEQP
jgi:hypothetical protein